METGRFEMNAERIGEANKISDDLKRELDYAVKKGLDSSVDLLSRKYVCSLIDAGELHNSVGVGEPADFYLRAAAAARTYGLHDLERQASDLLADHEVDKAYKHSEGFSNFIDDMLR